MTVVVTHKIPYSRFRLTVGRLLGWLIEPYLDERRRRQEVAQSCRYYVEEIEIATAELNSPPAAGFAAGMREAREARIAQARAHLATDHRYVAAGGRRS